MTQSVKRAWMNSHSKTSSHDVWHLKTQAETLAELATSVHSGLDQVEVERRRETFGSNIFQVAKRKSPWRMLLGQFTDFLILVLLAAALIAVFLGEPQDSIAILAIVLLNGILGGDHSHNFLLSKVAFGDLLFRF